MSRFIHPPALLHRRAAVAAGLVAVLIGAAGCGNSSSGSQSTGAANPSTPEQNPAGDIPDTQVYVRYRPPGADYSVKVPEGWARKEAGGVVTFTDKLNSIRMEEHPASSAPAVSRAKAELAKLAGTVKGIQPGDVTTVDRPAGKAIRITYLAQGPKDPVTGKARVNAVERYVFFHNGKEVVLTLSGPKGADNVDPWKIVTDSLRWER
jgi:hypothetical protein